METSRSKETQVPSNDLDNCTTAGDSGNDTLESKGRRDPVVDELIQLVDGAKVPGVRRRIEETRMRKSLSHIPHKRMSYDRGSFQELVFEPFSGKNLIPDFDQSVAYAQDPSHDKHVMGIASLFYGYPHEARTWDALISVFRGREVADISSHLIYYLAHIPAHSEIDWNGGASIDMHVRETVAQTIAAFDDKDVAKLLGFLEREEVGFERGAIGHYVDALVRAVEDRNAILRKIVLDSEQSEAVRSNALLLLASYRQKGSLGLLSQLIAYVDELQLIAFNIKEILMTEGQFSLY